MKVGARGSAALFVVAGMLCSTVRAQSAGAANALYRARHVQAGLPDPLRASGPRDAAATVVDLEPLRHLPAGTTVLRVGPRRPLRNLRDALDAIARRRIPADGALVIELDASAYEHTVPIHIRHLDAARIRIRGAPEIPISIRSVEPSRARGCPVNALALDVGRDAASTSRIGGYVLVHNTVGEDGADIPLRGVWEICGRAPARGTISIAHHRGVADAIPVVRSAQAVVLGTVMRFFCSAGIIVEGTELGLLEDVVLVGDYGENGPAWNRAGTRTAGGPLERFAELAEPGRACDHVDDWTQNHAGITAWREGSVTLGQWVGVTSFDGQGVLAADAGLIRAHGVASVHNQRRGFYAMNRAQLELEGAIANANLTDGFLADHGGVIRATDAVAVANHENGVSAMFAGYMSIERAYTTRNGGWGLRAKVGGRVHARAVTSRHDVRGNQLAEHGGEIADAMSTVPPLGLREALEMRARRTDRLERVPSVSAGREIVVPVGPGRDVRDLAAALEMWRGVYIPTNVTVRIVLDPGEHEIESLLVDHPCGAQIEIVGAGLRDPSDADHELRVHIARATRLTNSPGRVRLDLELEAGVGAEALRPGDVLVLTEPPPMNRAARALLGAWSVEEVRRDGGAARASVTTYGGRLFAVPTGATIEPTGLRGVIRRTRLQAACEGVVVRGTSLGMLGNLVLIGSRGRMPCASTTLDGVRVERGGYAVLGPTVAIAGFGGSGLDVRDGSAAYARSVVAVGNGRAGVIVGDGSTIEAKNSIAAQNDGGGFVAGARSTLYVALSSAIANSRTGFVATANGHLSATESFSAWNGMHGYASEQSVIDVPGRAGVGRERWTQAYANGLSGYFARAGVLALDRSVADANGHGAVLLLDGAITRDVPIEP